MKQKGVQVKKKEIRTRYSGLILFTAKLFSVATGAFFAFMIARSITQTEFGIYGTFNIIIPYFSLFSTAIPFWVMRFVARKKEGAVKTGIVANTIIATIATFVYIAFLPTIITTFRLQNYVVIYGIAATYIIELYFVAILEACLQAQRPHFVGYGILVGEVCRVILGYILIISLQLSLFGVILSLIMSFAIKVLFYFRIVWRELQKKISFSYIKEWVKGSSFNIYNLIGDRIAASLFLTIPIYGGGIATSYFQAALPIANIITYSSFLAYALYPKILAENKVDDITISLKMVLMFAVPMTVGVLTIPSSYLIILKDIYVPAAPVLMILAVNSLIHTLKTIFNSVLFGIEKVDEKAKIPFKQVVKSRLFIVFTLPYVYSLIALPAAFYILTNFTNSQPLFITMYVTLIDTIVHFVMLIIMYIIVRKTVKLEIPWKSTAKYIFASVVMATILVTVNPMSSILTLFTTAVGGIIYLALLILIDKETRTLAIVLLQKIKNYIGLSSIL